MSADTIETIRSASGHSFETFGCKKASIETSQGQEKIMWNRFTSAFKKAEARRRTQHELDHLFSATDDILRDIGVTHADVIRAKKGLKYL